MKSRYSPTNQRIFENPDTSGRVAKCAIELSEYVIKFEPAIKAQALADFLAEMTMDVGSSGSAPAKEVATDLRSPMEHRAEWEVGPESSSEAPSASRWHLPSTSTSHVAEYEAVIKALQVARSMGVRRLVLFTDSQLVVHQVGGEL